MMNNTPFSLENFIRQSEIKLLTIFSSVVFCFLPALTIAASAEHWIGLAENSCIFEKSYNVDRKTIVYHEQADTDKRVTTTMALVDERSAQLSYRKGSGLKPKSQQKTSDNTSSSPKPSTFTVDVGHMLQKMKGNAQWELEDENALLDGQECAVLISSGEKWLVRLWIRKKDSVVVRYDQYLNSQFLGTSHIQYYPPMDGKYLPKKTSTRFHLTNHIFVQEYENYSFSENEQ